MWPKPNAYDRVSGYSVEDALEDPEWLVLQFGNWKSLQSRFGLAYGDELPPPNVRDLVSRQGGNATAQALGTLTNYARRTGVQFPYDRRV